MAASRVFAARLIRLPVTDDAGLVLGRVEDVVVGPAAGPAAGGAPPVLGFVVNVQRRHIFVNAGRVRSLGATGVGLKGGTVDLRPFRPRPGEVLVSSLLRRRVGAETVADVAIRPDRLLGWEVAGVALIGGRALRRTRRIVDWKEAASLFDSGPVAAQVAALRGMKPTELAATVHALPPRRRALVARSIPEEQLADILEELPEDEQVRLLADMDVGRVADVIEEMEPDDAVDLLAAMPAQRRADLLAEIEPEDADSLRRLLRYDATTAGGLMTPEPVIVTPDTAVAEVLARLRDPELPAATAAQAFVCEPPTTTPTGPYLGMVGFQRLLREPPAHPVGECIADESHIAPDLAEIDVAARLAAYNLVGVAVCDEAGRLVGAVTVDDVLDRVLPADWRRRSG
ncbi:MAG TPA: CBS domain-containing protein [Acidimicrobiales bacterium]|jgi:CBS domain-containing protein|nr:CBS domain-containing protein [Acidimicrobiales bacterium]